MIALDVRCSARRGFFHALARTSSFVLNTTSIAMARFVRLSCRRGVSFSPHAKEIFMKSSRLLKIGIVALALAGVGLLSETTFAQKTKGKTRELTTKQLMKGFVVVNCGGLSN